MKRLPGIAADDLTPPSDPGGGPECRSVVGERPVNPPSPRIRWLLVASVLVALSFMVGCARLIVTSNPEGAAVLWSPDGLPPWRPWPPVHWNEYGSASGAAYSSFDNDAATSATAAPSRASVTTPFAQRGPHADYFFVTVAKEGYYPPRPRLVGMSLFRTAHADFVLRETPERFAARQRALGMVPYRGAWVVPADYGLVEHEGEWMPEAERTRRGMRARGFVEFEGRWLTPTAYETAFAERQRGRGLVFFKERWTTPKARAEEEAIDAAVARIAAAHPPPLEMSPPKVLGRFKGEWAGLGLLNPSGRPVRCLLSGPASRRIDLAAGAEIEPEDFRLLPGRYTVAVFPIAPSAPPDGRSVNMRDTSIEETMNETPSPEGPADLPSPPLGDPVILVNQPVTSGFHYQLTFPPLD